MKTTIDWTGEGYINWTGTHIFADDLYQAVFMKLPDSKWTFMINERPLRDAFHKEKQKFASLDLAKDEAKHVIERRIARGW